MIGRFSTFRKSARFVMMCDSDRDIGSDSELRLTDKCGKIAVKRRARASIGSDQDQVVFDDLLPHIGEFGRYQKQLFFYLIPITFFLVFVYFAQIFITLVPENHWCHVPELTNQSNEVT